MTRTTFLSFSVTRAFQENKRREILDFQLSNFDARKKRNAKESRIESDSAMSFDRHGVSTQSHEKGILPRKFGENKSCPPFTLLAPDFRLIAPEKPLQDSSRDRESTQLFKPWRRLHLYARRRRPEFKLH